MFAFSFPIQINFLLVNLLVIRLSRKPLKCWEEDAVNQLKNMLARGTPDRQRGDEAIQCLVQSLARSRLFSHQV